MDTLGWILLVAHVVIVTTLILCWRKYGKFSWFGNTETKEHLGYIREKTENLAAVIDDIRIELSSQMDNNANRVDDRLDVLNEKIEILTHRTTELGHRTTKILEILIKENKQFPDC